MASAPDTTLTTVMSDPESPTTLPSGHKRFVIRDELGNPVQAWAARTRNEAIKRFCYPALIWRPFEADGWTCREEPMS